MDIQKKQPQQNPISAANFFSKHFLVWFWPIFRIGYKRTLTLDDLWDPAEEDQARVNVKKLESSWQRQLDKTRVKISAQDPEIVEFLPNNNHPVDNVNGPQDNDGDYKLLLRAIWETFGAEYFFAWPMLILTDCGLKVLQPLFMLLLVRTFIIEPRDETAQYLYAAGVCITTFLITLTSNPCLFYLGRLCQRCRIALASLMQRKVLRLSASNKQTDQGQITNLITNDTFTIETSLLQVPYIVVAPLQLIIFLWFLYVEFGLSSIAGVCFILIYMPFQYINGTLSTKYRGDIGKKTDERSRVLSEVIDAIQSVKMYAWEVVFQKILSQRRKEEVKQLRKRSRLHAFQMSVFLTSSRVVPFLTFTAFVLLGGPLTADRVFYAVAVYNTMTHYMVFMLPGAIRALGEIKGSLRRLQRYLQLPESPSNGSSYQIDTRVKTPGIVLNDVTSSWYPNNGRSQDLVLSNLNSRWEGNKLVVVVGKTACGKTALLHLILNELHITSGDVILNGNLSYAPQEANLFPGTIRANVLNGATLDEKRYQRVLEAACLERDINTFPKRDMTRVIGLSGGQKARVNLARALYHKANIYLLDDPLGAVDAGVSRSIFENAIQGFLGNTLRILVTHQLDYLDEADHVIVMHGGTIKAQGSYANVGDVVSEYLGNRTDASVDALMANDAVNTTSAAKQGVGTKEETAVDINDDEVDEEQGQGALGLNMYWKYFNAAQSRAQLTTYLLIFIVAQVFTTLIEYWLALWTNAEEKMYEASLTTTEGDRNIPGNDTDVDRNSTFTWQGFEHFLSNLDSLEQNYYLYVYLILTAIVFVTNLAKAVAFFQYCMRISTNIHEKMLRCLLRAVPSFFDDNPTGRIMNRFTKDMATIDEQIPFQFFDMWTIFLQVGTVILLIIFAIWYSVVPVLVFLLLLGYVRRYYVNTSRDLKRIDGTTRSPVISHVQATFSAVVTMRALGAGEILSTQFDSLQDTNTSATISFLAASQCFNIWIEILATILLTFVAFGFLLAQNYLGMNFLGGNVGLAICSAMSLTIWLQYGMKVSANVENLMISVERALKYTKLESEAPLEDPSKKPPPGWPNAGKISFQGAYLSYRQDDNDLSKAILRNLSFEVKPGEKIGIVGQTGMGKSSVLRALFRMTELKDGSIIVDDRDIRIIGLHDLRKSLVIIPQEPKLFKGTLAFNLIPTAEPEENAETATHMKTILDQIDFKKALNFQVDDKGGNLSFGERQLVSIARALLLKRKIVCLDEATAHIDQKTDQKIQDLLRTKLNDSTTITIAHRLGTVIESDRILVLHHGQKKEYDHPYRLLQKSESEGWLTRMVNKTGKDNASDLHKRASKSWKNRSEDHHRET